MQDWLEVGTYQKYWETEKEGVIRRQIAILGKIAINNIDEEHWDR